MKGQSPDSWQIILADLSLILFLTAIGSYGAAQVKEPPHSVVSLDEAPQAIFREQADGSSLSDWIVSQTVDSRAQLTIVAVYQKGNLRNVWNKAMRLSDEADQAGHDARIALEPGLEDDVYAIIAFNRRIPLD